MTDEEARRILDEHRVNNPVFIRGRFRYVVRRDGRVNVWHAVGKSGKRWMSGYTVAGDEHWLPREVRERAACERASIQSGNPA